MLLQMPDHILTRIFNLLELKDRLTLCLVCRQLHDFFGNEKAIMENILLCNSKYGYKCFLNLVLESSRKYRNLLINFENVDDVDLLPLTKFQSLTELTIESVNVELKSLSLLLNNLPNLEVFVTRNVHLENEMNSTEKLICKKLIKLETNVEIFWEMMETPDLIDLKVKFYNEENNLDLEKFRRKTVNLKKLKYLHIEAPIFNEEFTRNAKFKLKEIVLTHEDWANSSEFLKAQNELQKVSVEINDEVEPELMHDIVDTILQLSELKNLKIKFGENCPGEITFEHELNISANTNIEALEILEASLELIKTLIAKIPSLTTLKLDIGSGFFEDDLIFLNTLKNLEKLSIRASDCVLPHLNLPKLKDFSQTYPDESMFYVDVDFCEKNILKFLKNHRNLKRMKIPKLVSKNTWKFIKKNLHQLEVFENTFYLSEYYRYDTYTHFWSDKDFAFETDHWNDCVIGYRKRREKKVIQWKIKNFIKKGGLAKNKNRTKRNKKC